MWFRGSWGRCILFRHNMRSFLALTASFGLTFKNSVLLRVFLRDFPLAKSRPRSVWRVPGTILRRFWRPKCLIFRLFGLARACCANFAQEQQNIVKTGTECTSEVSRDKTKTTKNGYKRRSILLSCSNRGQGRLRASFGYSRAGNLASKTANMAAKTAYLASKTAQLAVRRPSQARF